MSDADIRTLIVDDQELMRCGMRMVLEAEPDMQVVGEASSGAEAIDLVRELLPDVVLMDVRMPEMDGVEATRRIVRERPTSRVLVLTTFDFDEYAFGSLRAGASGFLPKNTAPSQLIDAIRAIAAGHALLSPRATRSLLNVLADRLPRGCGVDDSRLSRLTVREGEVLVALAQGCSNREISEKFSVSESTVKTHVGRVLSKLNVRDRVQAVILAYEVGLVGQRDALPIADQHLSERDPVPA